MTELLLPTIVAAGRKTANSSEGMRMKQNQNNKMLTEKCCDGPQGIP
jgi:hypothetical protein